MNAGRYFLVLALSSASLVPLATRAHAQLNVGGGGPTGAAPGGGEAAEKKKPAPPSSIPGAVANAPVVPATRNPNDLDPNAALFDAIDRGDMAAARDALSRGADLNARNVLGQRPIDMSIDLSRNDITFLLLSMRSQNGDQAPATEGGEQSAAKGSAPAAIEAAATPRRRGHHAARSDGDATERFASTAHSSGQAAADTPQPSAGFLGFGSH